MLVAGIADTDSPSCTSLCCQLSCGQVESKLLQSFVPLARAAKDKKKDKKDKKDKGKEVVIEPLSATASNSARTLAAAAKRDRDTGGVDTWFGAVDNGDANPVIPKTNVLDVPWSWMTYEVRLIH